MVDAPRAVSSEASPTRPLCAVSRPGSPAAAAAVVKRRPSCWGVRPPKTRAVGGPEGQDRGGGAALEIAHVGGGPLLVGFRATHGDEDRARGGGRRHIAPLERGGVGAAEPALEEHRGERLVERAAAGGEGVRGPAVIRIMPYNGTYRLGYTRAKVSWSGVPWKARRSG